VRPTVDVPSEVLGRLAAWCAALPPDAAVAERWNLEVAVAHARSREDRDGTERCGRLLLAAIWEAGTEEAARRWAADLDLPVPTDPGPRRARLGALQDRALEALERGDVPGARGEAAAARTEAARRVLAVEVAWADAFLARIDGRAEDLGSAARALAQADDPRVAQVRAWIEALSSGGPTLESTPRV
jgi:hypothetical protein